MKAELVHKNEPCNACVRFYGEYVSDEVRAAILAAGWEAPQFPPSQLPADTLEDWMETDTFNQPQGSGLFGGSTPVQGAVNVVNLKEALAPFGITLKTSRKLTRQELM